MRDHFAATVKAFFNGVAGNGDGGFEIQFNVRSREEFERAMEDPEKYGDFLVRSFRVHCLLQGPQSSDAEGDHGAHRVSAFHRKRGTFEAGFYLKALAKNLQVNVGGRLPSKRHAFQKWEGRYDSRTKWIDRTHKGLERDDC